MIFRLGNFWSEKRPFFSLKSKAVKILIDTRSTLLYNLMGLVYIKNEGSAKIYFSQKL